MNLIIKLAEGTQKHEIQVSEDMTIREIFEGLVQNGMYNRSGEKPDTKHKFLNNRAAVTYVVEEDGDLMVEQCDIVDNDTLDLIPFFPNAGV